MSRTHRPSSLRRAGIALVTLAVLVAAGCGGTAEPDQVRRTVAPPAPTPGEPALPPVPQQGDASVRGSVTYRERIALTPDATLTVQIRDTSYADAAAELIAEKVIPNPGQVPIRFEVLYESARIDPRNIYSVSARITEADGRLAFINDTAYDVITRGNPTAVDMVLVLVEPPPEMVDGEWNPGDDRPVEEPVTVTGTELLWERSDLYVRVTFVIADQDGCYRRGREEATVDGSTITVTVTAWVPPPTPWAIDCSNKTLELDAIAHVTPLTSGQTYSVNVNGQVATTFAAP
ncbi:MAG: YbaY family lipoprotein [bacterium]|nr:YbaY family lipoprotein [bacterium]